MRIHSVIEQPVSWRMARLFGSVVGAVALVATACGSEGTSTRTSGSEPAAADGADDVVQPDSIPAVLSLSLAGGQVVSFHEMGDVLLVSEQAPNGVRSALADRHEDRVSASETFEFLRPGEAVPAELLDAIERTEVARANAAASPTSIPERESDVGGGAAIFSPLRGSDGVGTRTDAITESHFLNNIQGCGPWPKTPVWQVCYPNWGNGFYAYKKALSAVWRVASITGSFNVQISASTGGIGSGVFFIGHDKWREFSAEGEPCCLFCPCGTHARTLRIDIINATNDYFHVGGAWWG